MQSKYFYRLIAKKSSKMNHQIITVFLIDQNILNRIVKKKTVADLDFNTDFVDMHFIYTHDHQVLNFLTNELLQIW